jgi:hypothetical protein
MELTRRLLWRGREAMGNCEKSQAQSWNTKLILSFRDLVIQVADVESVNVRINLILSENVLRRA